MMEALAARAAIERLPLSPAARLTQARKTNLRGAAAHAARWGGTGRTTGIGFLHSPSLQRAPLQPTRARSWAAKEGVTPDDLSAQELAGRGSEKGQLRALTVGRHGSRHTNQSSLSNQEKSTYYFTPDRPWGGLRLTYTALPRASPSLRSHPFPPYSILEPVSAPV